MNEGYAYYNDINNFCCNVLRKNVARGYLPGGKIDERDIREVRAADFMGYQHIHLFAGVGAFALGMAWAGYPSSIRTLSSGFPCQPFSLAGKREGEQDERYLWGEVIRIIREFRPECILLENMPGLLSMERGETLGAILRYWPRGFLIEVEAGLKAFAYELRTLVHRINGKESSLWPTPTATESGFNQSNSPNAKIRPSLRMIARKGLWPTPAYQDGKNATCPESQKNRDTLPGAMWRTPQHADWKSSRTQAGHTTNLTHQVRGNLNPDWVETLMGFPPGWTDLSDGLLDLENNSTTGSLQELSLENSKTEQSA